MWLHKEVWCEVCEQEATGEQMKSFTSVLSSDMALLSEGLSPRLRVPEEVTSYKNAQEKLFSLLRPAQLCQVASPYQPHQQHQCLPPVPPPVSYGESRQLLAPCSACDCTAAEKPEALGFGVTQREKTRRDLLMCQSQDKEEWVQTERRNLG